MVDGPASEPELDPWRPIGGGRWVGSDPSTRFPVYTRGNAGEVYPEVFTPLTFTTAFARSELGFRNTLLGTGLLRPEEFEGVPISAALGAGVFGGYAYLNLSTQRVMSARFPGGSAADADVNFLGVGQAPPHTASSGERNLRASVAGLIHLIKVLRRRELAELESDQRRVDAVLASLPPLSDQTNLELREQADSLVDLSGELFERHLMISAAAGLAVGALAQICTKQLSDPDLAVHLLGGLGDVDSAAPSSALWALGRQVGASRVLSEAFDQGVAGLWDRLTAAGAEPEVAAFVSAFATFLDRFGSRGPNEWDTAFDTWETNPELPLALVDRMRATDDSHDPRRRASELAEEAAALEQATLLRLKRPSKPIFRRILAASRLYSRSRERSKTTVVKLIHGARVRSMELDRRLLEISGGQRGDLWFLLNSELDDYVGDPRRFTGPIAERRAMHAELKRRIPPFFFEGTIPPLEEWEFRDAPKAPVAVGEILQGLPGCRGISRGRARVVLDPADPRGLAPGDVLIAPLTDPSWTPLFVAADAVVVDVGAVMSHAVIVSRELGIPCAVSVTDATRRIPDGALLEVNGSSGQVTILELPNAVASGAGR